MRTLTVSLLLMVLLTTAGLGWLFDKAYQQFSAPEQQAVMEPVDHLMQLGSALAAALDGFDHKQALIDRWQTQHPYRLELMALQHMPMPPALLDELKQAKPVLLETTDDIALYFYLAGSQELLVLRVPQAKLQSADNTADYLFTLLFYSVLVLFFWLWLYPLIRQLQALRQATDNFARGQLQQRVRVGRFSYIRQIQLAFNHMAQRIESLVNDVKLLSSAVSHDLRTPLARIRFGLDTLAEEADPQLRHQFEQRLSDNVEQMTELVESLLRYARLDQSMIELQATSVDLTRLIEQCIRGSASNTTEVQWHAPPSPVTIEADSGYLKMLINNLLQNAIAYGKGEVQLSLTSHSDTIQLQVEDNGEGVSEHDRDNIFKPFIRGEQRREDGRGHGIGLALVKRICEHHQGHIEVDRSTKLGGARFTVTFAKHPAKQDTL